MGNIVQVNQESPREEALREAASVLAADGVLVMPTDSVYGIGCAATPNNAGHERIFTIKQRDRAQTLPWLVADAADLARFAADVPPYALALARRFWPGALTLVVRASAEVPPEYRAADGTIALRCPNSNLVRELVRRVGAPLATTSANTHGMAAATTGSGIEERIVAASNLTLDAGPAPVGVASTIVSCLAAKPQVLREGALSAAQIEQAVREA